MRSQPACANARATSTASSPVRPPSTQSVAEMRTDIGFSSGHTARMARKTSSGKRRRFFRLPPYFSPPALGGGEKKTAGRKNKGPRVRSPPPQPPPPQNMGAPPKTPLL